MARKKKRILTPEEEAWEAGYDERTHQMLDLLSRRRAAIDLRKAREDRRKARPLLLRWLPL